MTSKADARAAIYSTLASAPTIHPGTADLFTDWTLQGGDVIVVHSDNVPYEMPVYSSVIKWTGQPKVTVSSSGNEQLDSIEDAAQKKAATKGNSYRRAVTTAQQNNEIHRAIYSEDGYMHTYIDVTASSIRTEVGSAISGMAQSVIEQTSTYIRTEVANAASSISATVIEQTAEYVRTEVADIASGVAWSVITQTVTGIVQEVGRKARVFVQWEDPALTEETLRDGDIWYKKAIVGKWSELATKTWGQLNGNKWKDFFGVMHYVRKNNAWVFVEDTSTVISSKVEIEHDNEHWAVVARQIDIAGEAYNSNLNVTARKISTDVSASKGELHSAIAQTATSILTRVENVKNGLQSSISQTASEIRLSVSASKSELYSSISQTASSIRMDVASAKSDLSSSIIQTADSIRTEVNAAKSTIYSSITQTASSIRAEVVDVANGLSASIEATASQIRSEVSSSVSGLQSSITQNANRIALVVDGNGIKPASIVAAINDGESSIIISANHINLDGYVKATDLTANLFKSKISLIDTMSVGYVSVGAGKSITLNGGSGTSTEISYASIINVVKDLRITQSGNTYTLQKKNYIGGETDWVNVGNFSRATTLTGAWSGGTYTVSASPQGNSISTAVYKGTGAAFESWSGNIYTGTIVYYPDGEHQGSVGRTFEVDASPRYNAGWADGQIQVAPYLTATSSGGYSDRTTNITSNGTYYLRAVIKPTPSSGWSENLDNQFVNLGLTVNVSGSNPYPQTKTLTCTGATFSQSQWVYTFRWTSNDANVFASGSSYKFHNNSSYT